MNATPERFILLSVFALTLTACGAKTATTSTPSHTTPAAITTAAASGPMTGDELLWLEGIALLHKRMDTIPATVSSSTMRSLADQLGGCTGGLDGLGVFTDRLRPVSSLAKQGCGQYEKSAQCFATAADLGTVVAGSAEERRHKEATDCAFTAIGEGSKLFADAEVKGFEIKDAAR